MPALQIAIVILMGGVAGLFSGALGIGGGVLLTPALVYILGYSQHLAQGTTLALLCLPVGAAAFVTYHREGMVNWQVALLLFCGFLAGSHFGARWAVALPELLLKRLFGVVLVSLGARMLFSR